MTPPIGYSLVWADEFDGTTLNPIWKPGGGLSVTHATLTGTGQLSLNVSAVGNYNNSSFIKTGTEKTFKYGYFECSAQISTVQGVCFAFWLYDPANTNQEIDIVERPGNTSTYKSRVICSIVGTNKNTTNFSGTSNGRDSFPQTDTGFHKYALLWTASQLRFYLDDVEIFNADGSASQITQQLEIYFDLCAASCSFQGTIVPTNTTAPTNALVEYVRVYQQGGPTPVLTSISVSPTTASINVGSIQQLTPTCKDQNSNVMTCPVLTWSSSDTSKATVNSSGLVTGVSAGTANITAKSGSITSNTSTITVVATPVLTSISVSPMTASINVSGTQQLTPTCKDQNSNVITCPVLTWSSSDTSKATVNSSGLVTGVSAGTANITAKSGSITSNTSTVTVTTAPPPTGSMFNVYQLGPDGVTVVKSDNGTQTATQASQSVSNILNTL
jgi:uncharacterized protein YjdB